MRAGIRDARGMVAGAKLRAKRIFFRHAPKPVVRKARQLVTARKSRKRLAAQHSGFQALDSVSGLRTPATPPSFDLKVGCILDEFSFLAWGPEFNLVPLDPGQTSEAELQGLDFLLVESAWAGNSGAWRYQLTGSNAPSADLRDLIATCNSLGIPTVFWNKEDPPHFDDFLETAALFDVVATTDTNMVSRYQAELPGVEVIVLPFAAQPAIHNPARNGLERHRGDVAFAGTYFRDKFPERREQMQLLLGAAHNVAEGYDISFTIFSRHAGGEAKYQFPSRFTKYVKGSLPYPEMLTAYRSYRLFLNVNSVVDSPSMCARRIFEISASGTPVLTTDSAALRRFFEPDEVASAATETEAENMIRALVGSEQLRRRMVHRAQRNIWENHTYRHRAASLIQTVGIPFKDSGDPLVTVICSTNRDASLEHLIQQVAAQHYPNVELVVLAHGIKLDDDVVSRAQAAGIPEVRVLTAPQDTTLGHCLNLLVAEARGEIVAKFDDDDFYLPNYLRDQVNTLRVMNADLVGKASLYFYLASHDLIVHRWPHREHVWHPFVSGSTLVGWRRTFEESPFRDRTAGEDSEFLIDVQAKGKHVYAADSFNYLCMRGASTHTWNIADSELLANSIVETAGFNLAHVTV